MMINVPDHVENEAAYIRAAQARIRANAVRGRRKRWLETSPTAQTCVDFLTQDGDFASIYRWDDEIEGERFHALHPVVKAAAGDFYAKMGDQLAEWGSLSEKQEAAVLRMIDRAKERIAARAEKAASAQWVGTVGERREFALDVVHVHMMDGIYGTTYITIMTDADGNTIVQKGAHIADKGASVKIKATIKAHGERESVRQTIVCRSKVLA